MSPSGSVTPGAAPTAQPTPLLDGASGTTIGVGWDSPTFNHGNEVYYRNVVGEGSTACKTPIAKDQIQLDLIAMTKHNNRIGAPDLEIADYDKAAWSTLSFERAQARLRKPAIALPPPSSWIPFDVYSGYFKVTNGGTAVSSTDQCFLLYVRHDDQRFDANTSANSNILAGYNDPQTNYSNRLAYGKIKSLTIPHFSHNGGTGSFELDNGWKGEIYLTNFATFEIGGYANGLDTVGNPGVDR